MSSILLAELDFPLLAFESRADPLEGVGDANLAEARNLGDP